MELEQKTFGRYAVQQHGVHLKESRDNGWLLDWKLTMDANARAETKFTLDEARVLMGADQTDGLRLEVTPLAAGAGALPPVFIPVNLVGDVRLSTDGEVTMKARMKQNALDESGASIDMIRTGSLVLECTVGDQPSLAESAGVSSENHGSQVDPDQRALFAGDQPTLEDQQGMNWNEHNDHQDEGDFE